MGDRGKEERTGSGVLTELQGIDVSNCRTKRGEHLILRSFFFRPHAFLPPQTTSPQTTPNWFAPMTHPLLASLAAALRSSSQASREYKWMLQHIHHKKANKNTIDGFLRRRIAGEPLQYILGISGCPSFIMSPPHITC